MAAPAPEAPFACRGGDGEDRERRWRRGTPRNSLYYLVAPTSDAPKHPLKPLVSNTKCTRPHSNTSHGNDHLIILSRPPLSLFPRLARPLCGGHHQHEPVPTDGHRLGICLQRHVDLLILQPMRELQLSLAAAILLPC